MATKDTLREWNKRVSSRLEGRKITSARYLTDREVENQGWCSSGLAIFLDDGNRLLLSQDDEGNGPGAAFTSYEDLEIIPVLRSEYGRK